MKIYKYGIEVCNRMYTKYGGHSQWIADILHVDYLDIHFRKVFFRKYDCLYYDGFHAAITICFICIAWGPWDCKRLN